MSRYSYVSPLLSLSVDITTLDGCCGIGSITRMGVVYNNTVNKKELTAEYKKAFVQWENSVQMHGQTYGMFMCTDVTPESWASNGAFFDYMYQRSAIVNLHDFAVANRFRKARTCINPKTNNDIVLFTKQAIDEYE